MVLGISVTAGVNGDGVRGRGALVVWLRVIGQRLGGQVSLPLFKALQSGCVSARGAQSQSLHNISTEHAPVQV